MKDINIILPRASRPAKSGLPPLPRHAHKQRWHSGERWLKALTVLSGHGSFSEPRKRHCMNSLIPSRQMSHKCIN